MSYNPPPSGPYGPYQPMPPSQPLSQGYPYQGYPAPAPAPAPYGAPPYPMPYQPPLVAKPDGGAIAVEAICGFFSLYGVGWMMKGKVAVGLPLMLGGILWFVFALVVSLFTAGFALFCLFPIHIALLAGDTAIFASQKFKP